ncbi:DUF3093 domain-containing protein [Agrococcus sp. HG114]|uniref:DUF3093 domain-containing protein n=1 Tax=Agrococcus sp. HG114 TaxID=2969757 RepID=UPI00215B35EB|nr:DUF3093 domain-containing protein [Agrococcus sp. HG114]MCR8669953.1 DUF3093 domain-containing protein [Agrococcus sp. HG114]
METAPTHRERLVPPWWLLLVLLLIVPAVLLVFLPIDVQAGIAIAVALYVGVVALLWLGAPVVELRDGILRAGRARIPVEHLGEPQVLGGDAATSALRGGWDPDEHHVVSPWTRALVRAAVVDPEDPTPAWLISSRRPERLAAAIEAARRH